MTRTYFQIEHEFPHAGRWYLNGLSDHAGNKLDVRDSTYGTLIPIEPTLRLSSPTNGQMIDVVPPLAMAIRRPGPPMEFTLGDFDVPVATTRLGELLARVASADIQRFPIRIGGHDADFEIVNVVSRIKCIDLMRSDITYWTEEDGLPEMVGKPQLIADLVVDSVLAEDHHLFRPEGWEVALIVSDIVKSILEKERVGGIAFRQVSGH